MTPEDLGFDSSRLELIGQAGRRYVDDGKMPCSVVQVARRGEVVYRDVYGYADVATNRPIAADSIFRIYSMTKPITSIAVMQLYENGKILLENPVSRFIPELADLQVWDGGSPDDPITRPAARQPTVRDVLTHTSGFTYGFMQQHPVDAMYRAQGLGTFGLPDYDLAGASARLGALPLLCDPGTAWNYSVSTDVCGHIVERVSGQSLDVYLRENIFAPLRMDDTAFSVDEPSRDRFVSLYTPAAGGMQRIDSFDTSHYHQHPTFLGGGGGLVSTIDDYQRFCDMLLAGGSGNGSRIIGPKTLAYMTTNHLSGGATLNEMGQSLFSETALEGTGFGLGFSVTVDPAALGAASSEGDYGWGGAASTAFWIDPAEELSVIFLTQLLPSSSYPIRRQLRSVVYQALTS